MNAGHNQHAQMPGLPVLRQAIADKTQRCYGVSPDMDSEITVTTGATEALFVAFTAFVHPGDEVILFDILVLSDKVYEHPPEQRLVRFCFAKDDATLEEACERLRRL